MNVGIDRIQLMFNLDLCEDDIIIKSQKVTERLFQLAISNQGTEISANILKEYNSLKEILHSVPQKTFMSLSKQQYTDLIYALDEQINCSVRQEQRYQMSPDQQTSTRLIKLKEKFERER